MLQPSRHPAPRLHETIRRTPAPPRARSPLPIVVALLTAVVLAQLLLGEGLGVDGAWMTPLLAAMLLAILSIVDARSAAADSEGETYDLVAVTVAAIAVGGAVACLYLLPLPWGGVAGAAVLVALVATLRMTGGS